MKNIPSYLKIAFISMLYLFSQTSSVVFASDGTLDMTFDP